MFSNKPVTNPEIQPTSPLDLAGAVVAAAAAGLVEINVLVCLGVVLVCLACVSASLSWVLDKVTESAEKHFGQSAVNGKSNRAADPLCEHSLTLVLIKGVQMIEMHFPPGFDVLAGRVTFLRLITRLIRTAGRRFEPVVDRKGQPLLCVDWWLELQ